MQLLALKDNDPRLRVACADVARPALRLREQQAEIDGLVDFVYGQSNKTVPGVTRDRSRPGTVGLSANQVGLMKRICVVDLSIGRRGYHDLYVLINPEITWRSKSTVEKVEGCVNFPTIWGKTRRARTVIVSALDRSGNDLTIKATGWPAVLLQHELDHLSGWLFIDRLIDPAHADLVEPANYERYRKQKTPWETTVDIRARVRRANL